MDIPFRLTAVILLCVGVASGQLVREANTTMTFPADLPSPTTYTTENALGSLAFSAPMVTAYPAGETNRLFVAERGGTIQAVTSLSTTPAKSAYLSLSSLLAPGETLRTDGENGFLSLTFHPNFAANRTLFVYFSIEAGGQLYQRLHQVTVTSASSNTATIAQHKPLLSILDRETNHNGGDLHFGADGFLYLSTGDEGAGDDSRNNARHINHRLVVSPPAPVTVRRTGFWGQLLRIAVEVDPVGQPGVFPPNTVAPNPHVQNSTVFPSAVHVGNYRIPADNPFHGYTRWHGVTIDPATVRTEIFATGLRNPFRWSIDPLTGRIFIGDVGQGTYEEVDIVAKGDDLGWSWREGMHPFTNSQPYPDSGPGNTNAEPPPPQPGDPPGTGFSPKAPIYEYDHTNDGIGSDAVVYGPNITGGVVYRGNRLPELFGKYLFAEYGNGMIVALTQNGASWTAQRIASDGGIVDFGYDPRNGDVIMCDLGAGTVKRLVRGATNGTPPPATLLAAGVFSDLANLTPHTGIVPYEPNVAFWSDYAVKSRWFSIKNLTSTVAFNADTNWVFPTGMVWVKHFDIELQRGNPETRRKLETRVIVKTANDIYGLSYRWNNIASGTQTDATLVAEDGLTEAIPGSNSAQTWRYPSRSECKVCHTQAGGFALSFNTRQMNRSFTYGGLPQNQISALNSAGYFSAPVNQVNLLPAFAKADDTSQSLEWRVRSYLAVNCVQCHQPNGPAQGNWNALATTPTDLAGLINGALINNFGDAAARVLVPGDAPPFGQSTHSMMLRRIRGDGVPRMPPLATFERNLAAEQLLTDWLTVSLPLRQSFAQWQQTNFGSTTAPEAQVNADPDSDGSSNSTEYLTGSSPNAPTPPIQSGVMMSAIGGNFMLQFQHLANRSCMIETTTDFESWSLWNVPGNAPLFPATDTLRTLVGPMDVPNRYFRLKFSQP